MCLEVAPVIVLDGMVTHETHKDVPGLSSGVLDVDMVDALDALEDALQGARLGVTDAPHEDQQGAVVVGVLVVVWVGHNRVSGAMRKHVADRGAHRVVDRSTGGGGTGGTGHGRIMGVGGMYLKGRRGLVTAIDLRRACKILIVTEMNRMYSRLLKGYRRTIGDQGTLCLMEYRTWVIGESLNGHGMPGRP